eukprot:m.248377 g.248377  ORF g.248377 m.248377 type:complete len:223 (+) comp15415_c1_seq1:131-799(+)
MQNSRSMGIRGCVVAVVMVLLCITLNTQATDLFDYGDWVELAKQDNDFEGHNVPSHRYNHGCVWDAKRNQMVIFMGYFYDHRNRRPTFCDDVWAYSLEQSTWALLAKAQGPSARYGHVVAIDPPSDRVIVHGGDIGRSNTKADTSHLADAWVFSLSSNTWTALSYNTQGDQGRLVLQHTYNPRIHPSSHTLALATTLLILKLGILQHTRGTKSAITSHRCST